ncbi:MAG TPA: ATP-binding cassette domain-containing protein [Burkholderiales bacterium]|jgi:ABC-type nitrate/sulfonate/bicarbonate transport system ATPase subunit/ABC-type nitrate/sulfonate/bicarbonate transport system permease component|nr:ATP-binding cassette domain-containing protein [Burkholderiales bacterium]
MLEISGLTKVFYEDPKEQKNELLVLDGIDLSVARNQFVCLLGPSGCGKSTLLRIVVGLTEADGGSVRVDGKEVKGAGEDRCMVFQSYGLLPWRNVRDNVEFGLEVRGASQEERRAACQRSIEKVGLMGFERHYPHQISGGMQQRTGLARALSKDPKILLMDEPFAAVDMQTRELLQEELLRIWNTTQTTVLFVTHSIEEAVYLGDRVIVMASRPGRILADVAIDLPRPRYASDVKASPRFGQLAGRLRELLHHDADKRSAAAPKAAQKVAPPRRERKFRLADHPNAIRAASLALTLGVWEWYGRGVDPIFFSYPTAIAAAVPQMIASGQLQGALFLTLQGLAAGFGLAIVLGILIGLLMGRYRLLDYLLDVQISALYSTPNVALIPLLILWFGLGMKSKIVIVFLAAFFPIIVNTYGGVRNVSRALVEVAQAEGASEAQIFGKVIVPAALPFIMTGIRLAVGRAVVGMVVAEMFTALTGLGGSIVYFGNTFATDKLFVVIILLALLGVALTEGVKFLEVRLAPWKETERAD